VKICADSACAFSDAVAVLHDDRTA
jgi:hypothetical protein